MNRAAGWLVGLPTGWLIAALGRHHQRTAAKKATTTADRVEHWHMPIEAKMYYAIFCGYRCYNRIGSALFGFQSSQTRALPQMINDRYKRVNEF